MRIIHFSCVAPPETGGIGRVASAEVTSLAERGHDAHLVSLTTHAGFRIGNVGSIHAVEHFVRGTDIVHLHYPFYGTAGAIAKLRQQGKVKRLAVTLHMDAKASGLKGLVFDLHRRYFQPGILNAADLLIGSSWDYIRHSSFAPFADRVLELPFGVDDQVFSPGSADRKTLGVPDGAFVVLFVGGMDSAHAFKGVPVLLGAIAAVPEAHLVLCGDGNRRRVYERIAKRLGIADRCHFLGRVGDAELPNAYRSADVLAFPSISGAEAFGLVALEAQACGTPVIASNLPGVRTVVADGETGLLVPPNDAAKLSEAIRRVKDDAVFRQQIAKSCRPRVLEAFTWKSHMDGLEAAYQKLCASPS